MSIRRCLSRLSILAIAFTCQACDGNKTGFVDIFKLVSEFELQKEYSAQARIEYEQARAAIDSAVFAQKLDDSTRSKALRQELYAGLAQKAEEHNKEIERIIWNRLNPYISDYGRENGYDYIYGANGTGTVLYADKERDVTEELVEYANNRYHGKSK